MLNLQTTHFGNQQPAKQVKKPQNRFAGIFYCFMVINGLVVEIKKIVSGCYIYLI